MILAFVIRVTESVDTVVYINEQKMLRLDVHADLDLRCAQMHKDSFSCSVHHSLFPLFLLCVSFMYIFYFFLLIYHLFYSFSYFLWRPHNMTHKGSCVAKKELT